MLIRPLEASDRKAVQAMLAGCGAFSEEEVTVALEIFDSGEMAHFGAEVEGILCGYVCLEPVALTRSTWHVYWLCVDASCQRRGVATALMRQAAEFARSKGGERLVVETSGRLDYERARRFYERVGFRQVGRIADYYKPGDDCVYYCKLLD
ncbi:MAG: GNAT family N-acetyltransferase [Bryobacterales bacterium]|nr:GNAT family N-acetyltransferase [Bryobacterales bacterium]